MGWKVIPPTGESDVVTAIFDGYLGAEEGEASAAVFGAAFADTPLKVVWDVTKMGGFDSRARSAWAEVVWPLRGQITGLTIVGAKGIVRAGATFLALMLGRPYEFVGEPKAAHGEKASSPRSLADR